MANGIIDRPKLPAGSEKLNSTFSLRLMGRENVFWETLESLKAVGASSLLVLPVEKMLP